MAGTTVTKADLTRIVQEEAEVTGVTASVCVNSFLYALVEKLSAGCRIELRDFGVFEIKANKERKYITPRKETKIIPSHGCVLFRPAMNLKREVWAQSGNGIKVEADAESESI